MDEKHTFMNSIVNAVKEIQTGGLTEIEELPTTSANSKRRVRLESWRTPVTVSDYRETDFAPDLAEHQLRKLSGLVEAFRDLTNTFDPSSPASGVEGEKADKLILEISKIIGNI